ncbi:hypothetical protein [Sphingomonas sp.]|uniref:hypothetical protein n=1 Tax=Sphingomonas sp. TaxID=28214 RepID=UPI002EDAFEBE
MRDRLGRARHVFEREWLRAQKKGRREPDFPQPVPADPHGPNSLSGGAAAPVE